jgi:hypothetical protein
MTEAAAIYDGVVMHARLAPFTHRFAYRVWSLMIDLDRIDEACRVSRVLRHNRFGFVSLHDRDHGPRDGTPLRAHVDRLTGAAGLPRPARVSLLCYPRVLGFTFNPLAVYYCRDAAGALTALVYEVRNTFGEMHSYVCPVAPGEGSVAGVRQERDKLLFVSPFLDLDFRYRFRLNDPAARLTLRILEVARDGRPALAASFSARRLPLSARTLARVSATAPLLGLKVLGAIHWEALRLWVKGARLERRPAAPPPASVGSPHRFLDPAPRPSTYVPPTAGAEDRRTA